MQDSAAQSPTGALALAPPTLAEHCKSFLANLNTTVATRGVIHGVIRGALVVQQRQLEQRPAPQRSAHPERFHRHCAETSPHPRRPSSAGYTCVIMHCRAFFAPA